MRINHMLKDTAGLPVHSQGDGTLGVVAPNRGVGDVQGMRTVLVGQAENGAKVRDAATGGSR